MLKDQVNVVVTMMEDYLKASAEGKDVAKLGQKIASEGRKIDVDACEFHRLVHATSQKFPIPAI